MKKWMQKFVDQFELDWKKGENSEEEMPKISEDRATLLYIIDTYSKYLIDIESQPLRKVRDTFDEYAKSLVVPENQSIERVLFKFRQFFSNYRIEEQTYTQKTFSDFKSIIWDFIDQLSEDVAYEEESDKEVHENLEELKDAVEADSIESLKKQSRQFIDFYMEHHSKKNQRKSVRMASMKESLDKVKEKLIEAKDDMRRDHLTSAFNRKSFDEQMERQRKLSATMGSSVVMLMVDIDHFKKVNDTYGHAIGDFVIQECVRIMQETCSRDNDFVARIGGEEFAIILPDYKEEHAVKKAEQLLENVRKEVFVKEDMEIRFTISIGISELQEGESSESWMKRADEALYETKNNGRDGYTVSSVVNLVPPTHLKKTA